MKKFFSLALVLCAFAVANAQYTDNFESYADFTINPAGAWTFYDLDESETYGINGITWENAGLKVRGIYDRVLQNYR